MFYFIISQGLSNIPFSRVNAGVKPYYKIFLIAIIALSLAYAGCVPGAARKDDGINGQTPAEETILKSRVMRSDDYAVILASPSDTYESLAEQYYGNKKLAYLISEFNDGKSLAPEAEVVVPLKPVNPGGLQTDGYQVVPVLCYHQFSHKKSSTKISVSAEAFEKQMSYLAENGYKVITLNELYDFISYNRRPPRKSVVITIDDGWKTVKTIAAPILKKHGIKATLFVYTGFIKSKPGSTSLSWDEIKEMIEEGVIEVQSHTVTHSDLTTLSAEQLEKEIRESRQIIENKLGIKPESLAYPYGNFSEKTIDLLAKYNYQSAFTVIKGGNAFFHNKFALNRSMVFNSEKLDDFIKLLDTFRQGE